MRHNYGACAPKLEKSPQGEARTARVHGSPDSGKLEKAGTPQPNPAQPKPTHEATGGEHRPQIYLQIVKYAQFLK